MAVSTPKRLGVIFMTELVLLIALIVALTQLVKYIKK